MYSHDELLVHSLNCNFGFDFPNCEAMREINTKIIVSWVHKQFNNQGHILLYIYMYVLNCIRIGHCWTTSTYVRWMTPCFYTLTITSTFALLIPVSLRFYGCVQTHTCKWTSHKETTIDFLDYDLHLKTWPDYIYTAHMGEVMKVRLSCYLAFLSNHSKTWW